MTKIGPLAAVAMACTLVGCGFISDRILKSNPIASAAMGAGKAAGAKAPIGLEEELDYGGAIAIKVVRKYGGLVDDPALQKYVGLVGNSVAVFSDRPELKYYFGVLKSEGVNAVSAPGGYVFITMGALRKMQSEAELAGVLAHEVGHITAKHALKIIQNLKASNAMVEATTRTASGGRDLSMLKNIMNTFLDDFLSRGLPKDTEFEADAIGTKLLIRTGYDPNGLKSFLGRMVHPKADSHDPFYDTHPDTGERVRKLEAQIAAYGKTGPDHAERMKRMMKLPAKGAAAETKPAETPKTGSDSAPVKADSKASRAPNRPK